MPEGGMAAKALPMAMQGAGAAKGGGGGGGKGGQQGGVSPEQKALAQYTLGQQLLQQRSKFASSGTGESTMSSYETSGPQFQMAQTLAGASDANQAAAQSQQNSLLKLAQQAQGQQNQQQAEAGTAAGIQSGATSQ